MDIRRRGRAVIVHMNYQQYRTARRLVHSCCNYDGGCCLLPVSYRHLTLPTQRGGVCRAGGRDRCIKVWQS